MPESKTQPVIDALSNQYPLLGIALKHHRSTRGDPMSFHDKPYLIELYCDSPHIDGFDAMKAVQVGWSELLVQLILERAGWSGRIAAYVLPSYQIRDRFVKRRIHPVLETVPEYNKRLPGDGDLGNLRIKRFGKGSLLFLGSNTVNDFIEFSADVLIVDEFDRCVPENLALARDRLRASPYPQLFRIGNPTLPKTGVAALFDNSDGRKWHFQCYRCNERQNVDWLINVVDRANDGTWFLRDKARAHTGLARPVCRKCGKPFDRVADGGGWVAERPTQPRRGYQVSRLDVLSQEIRPLFHEWEEAQGSSTKLSAFFTSVLGKPYTAKGSAVDATMLANAATGSPMDVAGGDQYRRKRVVAGVDVGRLLNVDISCVEEDPDTGKMKRVGVFTGAVTTFEQVYDMLLRYHVDCCVIDARPETRKAQELRDKCSLTGVCDTWLAQFHPTDRIGKEDYGMRTDYDRKVVTVDRTQLLDVTLDDLQVSPTRRVYPEDIWRIEGWTDQMTAPKRVFSEKSERYIWHEGSAEDHYRFSDAYQRIALDLLERQGGYFSG